MAGVEGAISRAHASTCERPFVARARTHLAVQARNRLGVVIENVGRGFQDRLHGRPVALKIGRQDLHAAAGDAAADGAYGEREQFGAAVFAVVAVHAGDHGEAQSHGRRGFGHAVRLVVIHRQGRAFFHRAEAAAARAHIPQNHESGRAMVPALAHIGTSRAFANRVQAQAADEALQLAIVLARGRGGAQPLRPLAAGDAMDTSTGTYCRRSSGGASTPTRAAALHSAPQLASVRGMPPARRSASARHSGSPATRTSSYPAAAGVDFIRFTRCSTRAVNSPIGHEPRNVDGQERLAGAHLLVEVAEGAHLIGHRAAAQHRAQNLHHHGQAAAFVPAQGREQAAVGRFGVGGRHAFGIECPASGDLRPALDERLIDAAGGYGGCGHIEEERAGDGHANGVGAQSAPLALPRRHDGGGVADRDADLPGVAHFLRPPGTGAEMVGFARRNHADPVLPGDADSVFAAGVGHPLSQPVLAVEGEAAPAFGDNPPVGEGIHPAGQQLLDVVRDQLDAVGIHAAQVGGDQGGGGDRRLVGGHSRARQDALGEGRQGGAGDDK